MNFFHLLDLHSAGFTWQIFIYTIAPSPINKRITFYDEKRDAMLVLDTTNRVKIKFKEPESP